MAGPALKGRKSWALLNKLIILERFNQNKDKYWKEIVAHSYKIASLVDICGHKKYLKAAINGLTGLTPNFGCVVGGGCKCGSAEDDEKHICCVCSSKSLSSWC